MSNVRPRQSRDDFIYYMYTHSTLVKALCIHLIYKFLLVPNKDVLALLRETYLKSNKTLFERGKRNVSKPIYWNNRNVEGKIKKNLFINFD